MTAASRDRQALVRLARRARESPEPLLLAALVVATVLLLASKGNGSDTPALMLLGVATGAPLAIQAIGMVLVYRSNRILNFSQVALGSLSAVLFYVLWSDSIFIRAAGAACGCVPDDLTYAAYWMVVVNFGLSVLAALVLAPLFGALVYVALIRPLENAPPLVLTMLTVAVAYLVVSGANLALTRVQGFFNNGPTSTSPARPLLPVDVIVRVSTVRLDLPMLLGILMAILLGLGVGWFFRSTSTGTVVRATADDPGRATTLGVSVLSARVIVWALAATVSAVALVISASRVEPSFDKGDIGSTQLVQLLAVVVIARLGSIPLAIAAAVTLGFVQQGMATALQSQTDYLAALLPIVGLFLLLQRPRRSRADSDLAAAWPAADEVRPIPRELLALPLVRRTLAAGAVLAAALLVGSPWLMSPADVTLASQTLILGVVALSVLVLSGWAGQISLGQLAIAAVGSYLTTVLSAAHSVPWSVAIVAGGVAGAMVATVVGMPALRLPGLYLAVTTLALSLCVGQVLLSPDLLGSALPSSLSRPAVFGLDSSQEQVFYYLCLGVLAIAAATVFRMRRSRTARALIACRDNERAAQAFGINLFRARLQAFAISGFLAALAGGFYAFAQNGTQASSYGVPASLSIFLVTLIGGLGSVWGPLIGIVAWYLVQLFAPDYAAFIVGGGLVLLFLLFPGGLGGVIFALRDAMLRRVALRNHISVPSLMGEADDAGAQRRARIAPKLRRGSSLPAFVPAEYRAPEQWSLPGGAIDRVRNA